MSWRALQAYLAGVAGVVLTTALIALVSRYLKTPNLSVLYILVVLLVAARGGPWPAVVTSVLGFAAYDFFFVPPVGTFTVAGPP